MKKFQIQIGASLAREVNANEYNVAPKLGVFGVIIDGAPGEGWTTSGKGKSAVNNHYIYFRAPGQTLYYFKSDASEVIEARKGFEVVSLGSPATPAPIEAPAPTTMTELMTALSTPTSKRKRVAKAKVAVKAE